MVGLEPLTLSDNTYNVIISVIVSVEKIPKCDDEKRKNLLPKRGLPNC